MRWRILVLLVVGAAPRPRRRIALAAPRTRAAKGHPKNGTAGGADAPNATIASTPLREARTRRTTALMVLLHACVFAPRFCADVANLLLSKMPSAYARAVVERAPAPAGEEGNEFIDFRAPGGRGGGVAWADVVGADAAVAELRRLIAVVGSRSAAEAARRSGATAPRNILLVGPPGTGKTLLARAAAEALDAPLLVVSGAEMVKGKYAGVGVERVKNLFSAARRAALRAPARAALVFIDELDSCGRSRGGDSSAVAADHDNTLNQLLVELDGFSARDAAGPLVVVLAATNRAGVLDAALLRKGRFDTVVALGAPDARGREALYGHYVARQAAAAATRELVFSVDGEKVLVRATGEAPLPGGNASTATLVVVSPARCAGARANATLFAENATLALAKRDLSVFGRRRYRGDPSGAEVLPYEAVHNGTVVAEDASLPADLAGLTAGFVGADVAAVVNEAALAAAERRAYVASRADYLRAVEDQLLGKPLHVESAAPAPDYRIAVHEAGHALASFLLRGCEAAVRASVRPRSSGALGATHLGAPADDAATLTRAQLRDRLVLLLAGRAAEASVFDGDASTGASDDLRRAADLAKAFVAQYGMSPSLGAAATVGDVDGAVRDELRAAERRAADLVADHDRTLRAVADAFLKNDTLDGAALQSLIGDPA